MTKKKLTSEQEKYLKGKINKMNVFLCLFILIMLAFTIVMIGLFLRNGCIPDTLCTCVFAVCGIEFGACAWIKTNKQKYENKLEEELFPESKEEPMCD